MSAHRKADMGITNARRSGANRFLFSLVVVAFVGCATAPMSAIPPGGVATPAPPMTLPRFLGVDSAATCLSGFCYRARVRLSPLLPFVAPPPPGLPILGPGHPANLASPAPAVAAAASIQAAEASAPAKIDALQYLARFDCSKNPAIEEAILAGMDDPVECVRAAAVQAVIDAGNHCGKCACQCGGCCTLPIYTQLQKLAFATDDANCWCEPSPRVRRLARMALDRCGSPVVPMPEPLPEEMPSPEMIQAVQAASK